MEVDYKNLYKIAHWFHLIETIDGSVNDIVYIKMKKTKYYIHLVFPRSKSLSYNEKIRDYIFNYSVDYEFLEFLKILKKTRKNKELNIVELKVIVNDRRKSKIDLQWL